MESISRRDFAHLAGVAGVGAGAMVLGARPSWANLLQVEQAGTPLPAGWIEAGTGDPGTDGLVPSGHPLAPSVGSTSLYPNQGDFFSTTQMQASDRRLPSLVDTTITSLATRGVVGLFIKVRWENSHPCKTVLGTVATKGALPTTGNAIGDGWVVTGSGAASAMNHLWVWSRSWAGGSTTPSPDGAAPTTGAPGWVDKGVKNPHDYSYVWSKGPGYNDSYLGVYLKEIAERFPDKKVMIGIDGGDFTPNWLKSITGVAIGAIKPGADSSNARWSVMPVFWTVAFVNARNDYYQYVADQCAAKGIAVYQMKVGTPNEQGAELRMAGGWSPSSAYLTNRRVGANGLAESDWQTLWSLVPSGGSGGFRGLAGTAGTAPGLNGGGAGVWMPGAGPGPYSHQKVLDTWMATMDESLLATLPTFGGATGRSNRGAALSFPAPTQLSVAVIGGTNPFWGDWAQGGTRPHDFTNAAAGTAAAKTIPTLGRDHWGDRFRLQCNSLPNTLKPVNNWRAAGFISGGQLEEKDWGALTGMPTGQNWGNYPNPPKFGHEDLPVYAEALGASYALPSGWVEGFWIDSSPNPGFSTEMEARTPVLIIGPADQVVPQGGVLQLHLVMQPLPPLSDLATYSAPIEVTDAEVTEWRSDNPSAATVDSTGLVTVIAASGSAVITANYGGADSASTTVTARSGAPVVTGVQLTPNPAKVKLGLSVQLSATATYSDGSTAVVTSGTTWTSAAPAIATVAPSGLVTSIAKGSTTISVTFNGFSSSVPLTVDPAGMVSITVAPLDVEALPGQTVQLTATGVRTDNSTKDVTSTAAWSSSDPTVATVAPGGFVTAVAPGFTVISASEAPQGSSKLCVGTATFTTLDPSPQQLLVQPFLAYVPRGGTFPFVAIGVNQDGSTVDVTASTTWTIVKGNAASITSSGLVTGLTGGIAVVKATNASLTAFAIVNVPRRRVVSFVVNPSPPPDTPNRTTQQFTAIATLDDGTPVDVTGGTKWASASTGTVVIDDTGLATGVNTGTAVITATFATFSANTTMNVTANPVTGLVVNPSTASAIAGTTVQLEAKADRTYGPPTDETTAATWSSSNGAIATCSKGLVTAKAKGTVTITAKLPKGSTTYTDTCTFTVQ